MALWGGRFTQATDKRFKDFNDSLRFDYRLAEQDIEGSIGWSKALVNVGADDIVGVVAMTAVQAQNA